MFEGIFFVWGRGIRWEILFFMVAKVLRIDLWPLVGPHVYLSSVSHPPLSSVVVCLGM